MAKDQFLLVKIIGYCYQSVYEFKNARSKVITLSGLHRKMISSFESCICFTLLRFKVMMLFGLNQGKHIKNMTQ